MNLTYSSKIVDSPTTLDTSHGSQTQWETLSFHQQENTHLGKYAIINGPQYPYNQDQTGLMFPQIAHSMRQTSNYSIRVGITHYIAKGWMLNQYQYLNFTHPYLSVN